MNFLFQPKDFGLIEPPDFEAKKISITDAAQIANYLFQQILEPDFRRLRSLNSDLACANIDYRLENLKLKEELRRLKNAQNRPL